MRVLLLGGTGAIGDNLTNILKEKDVSTFVTSRRKRTNSGSIVYLRGNAHDNQFMEQICSENWDAIVDFMSYKTPEFKNRVKLLLSCTNQYVFISSARVYADVEHPIKETSPRLIDVIDDPAYLSTDEYAITKARQENLIKSNAINNNYTIVRPYITYSNQRFQLGVMEKEEWLFRALQGHTVVFPEEMCDKITTMTNGFDVALGIYNLLGNKNALGETFHITSEEHRTWKEIIDIYSSIIKDITGGEMKIKLVPLKDFLYCRNKGLEWQVLYDRMYNRVFDTTKESFYAGSKSFICPEKGIRDCLRGFLNSGGKFNIINYKNEAKKDKLTGEHCSFCAPATLKQRITYFINRYVL